MPRKAKAPLSQPIFGEPVFNEGVATPDPTQFHITPNDNKFYTNEVNALVKTEVVSFPESTAKDGDLFPLVEAWGPHGSDVINSIKAAQCITFHMIGDSGATAQSTFPAMIKVSDAVTNDFQTSSAANRPSFLYHLGDVVYNFGESTYYYDEFYEPYRNYPAPIFAIPGNHDSFVLPNTAKGQEPLTTFMRNFCGPSLVVTKEAGSLHRTCMTEPGVYFALDAPFVRILGLFSNALEDPGVISSETTKGKAKWPAVPDYQLSFLTAQLQNIKSTNYKGAVILAVHHPPFSYAPQSGAAGGGKHPGNSVMLGQIDAICKQAGVYPHAFISGHAHNYQRFTRSMTFGGKNYSVPFIVCGDSGHNVDKLVRPTNGSTPPEPGPNASVKYLDVNPQVTATNLVINQHDDVNSGFLRVSATAAKLTITFNPVSKTGAAVKPDTVTVDLATHTAA
jgi:hypothetical protein